MSAPLQATLRSRYLDLLQAALTGELHQDPALERHGHVGFHARTRELGQDWPSTALTMIGRRRLQNLRDLAEAVLEAGVPGDFMEAGVWRGGACILLRAVLEAHGERGRRVWVADSFAGLPPPRPGTPEQASDLHTYPELAVSLAQVRENFGRYGYLDEQVAFLPGWFCDTLPQAPIAQLALLRLDGDLYSSTMDVLTALYPKVAPGGAVIIDDYHAFDFCRQAVHDYLDAQGLKVGLEEIDGTGVYWRKPLEGQRPPAAAGAPPHIYDYPIDPASGSSQAQLLRFIGRDKRVLELGAGPGSLSRHLSAAGCHVVALDKDPAALAILRGRCARSVEADLSCEGWEAAVSADGPFDAIVLGDVLEHLLDPEALLKRLPPLLSAQGSVLVSLPHVGHAGLRAALMDNDFPYRPDGLLDRTHLRFFGIRNMQALFHQAGYKVLRAERVLIEPALTEFAQAWAALSQEQRSVLEAEPFADTYQLVAQLVPAGHWPGQGVDLLDLAPPRRLEGSPAEPSRPGWRGAAEGLWRRAASLGGLQAWVHTQPRLRAALHRLSRLWR